MNTKKKILKQIMPAILLSVPMFLANADHFKASERLTLLELKNYLLNPKKSTVSTVYDLNKNGKSDVFDLIRLKRTEYGIVEEVTFITTSPAHTTASSPVTTSYQETSVSETTTPVSSSSPKQTTSPPISTITSTTSTEPVLTTTSTYVTTSVSTTTTKLTTTVTTTTPPVTTSPSVTTPPQVTTPPPVTAMPQRKFISNMRSFVQEPELPTGCEATGLTIALRWYGYDIDKVTIATKYMPQMAVYYSGGRMYGPDFMTTFAGNPTSTGLSYGCYIPCLKTTAERYFKSVGSSYRAKDITGTELEDLFPYVANNTPVVLISTPELMTPYQGDSWYTPDGRYVTWQRGHHCMVLMGYDKTRSKVYCADPMMRKGIVEYDLAKFKQIYNMKKKSAMIIDTGSVTVPSRTASVGETVRYVGYMNSTSEGNGIETYYDSNVYTVTKIHPDESLPYRVCLGNIGWVSMDALRENIAYFGSGSSDPNVPVNSGIYNIKNAQSLKYINVDYGKDVNETNIYQWSKDNSTEQKFKLFYDGTSYKICAMCSSNGADKVITASWPASGYNIYLYSQVNTETQQWIIKEEGNAYIIALKAHPSLVLTASGYNNGSANGTLSSSAGNIYLSEYTGAKSQLWYFE